VTAHSPLFAILLISSDPSLAVKLKQELKGASITVTKDVQAIPRPAAKRGFDAVIVETSSNSRTVQDLAGLKDAIDPAHVMLLAGPPKVLKHVGGILDGMRLNDNGRAPARTSESSLETFLESRLGDFVRGMRASHGGNLHPMLIKAVERPLISLVLKETNGNQLQAAELLGMNRNTLRKKIAELRIAVTRESMRKGSGRNSPMRSVRL
jgi:two-component system nitrogen regulation response regulator GlnG